MFGQIATLGTMIILFWIAIPSFAIELKTAAQESTPKYYQRDDKTMGGICVDIMQAIEKVDPEIKFSGYQRFIPFKRLQQYIKKGKLDVFFGFKMTPGREQEYNFLDIPLYQLNYVLAARSDDKVNVNSLADIRSLGNKGNIITVYGTAASRYLTKKHGLVVDNGARSPRLLLKKLSNRRGRFAFYHDLALRYLIKHDGLEKKLKILPTSFLQYYHYAIFSKNVSAEVVAKVRRALEKIKDTGELARIHAKYSLPQ